MDSAVLVRLLQQTLDPASRATAEDELKGVQKIIGFCPALLHIIMDQTLELPVRQAGVIYFKNMVSSSWVQKEYDVLSGVANSPSGVPPPIPFNIHEQDRDYIRQKVVDAIVEAPEVLRIQLAICILYMVKHDFPGRWPGIVDQISKHLGQPNPQHWPGALLALYQLVKNYEYKKKEDRGPLYEGLQLLMPQVYRLAVECGSNPAQEISEIRKQILKIFFALTQFVLPVGTGELLSKEVFTQWMEVFNAILMLPVPDSVEAVDAEERPQVIWWKEKKWALHILARIFERYGSPGNVSAEYKEFAEWYIRTFSSGIVGSLLKVLEVYRAGGYVSPRVLQQALNYLNVAVSHAHTWKLLRPHAAALVTDIVFPVMSYTADDAELWDTDPYEYIRVKFDIFEDFVSPVTAAQTLLYSICKKRKNMLEPTMNFLLQKLQDSAVSGSQKDGAMHMIGTMASILLRKNVYKNKMEQFLEQLVFPVFASPLGHLRARAAWMLHYFANVKYKNPAVLGQAFQLTVHALLNDTEAPVRVEAAIALQMMLNEQGDAARDFVAPKIGEITMQLLQIIRDTENDDMNSVLQKIMCTYTEQLMPLAENICSNLVVTFQQVLQGEDAADEKAITAMGLLNTMETILSVTEERPEVHAKLEPIVLQSVRHIFAGSVMEFYEEALSLCCDLTTSKISPAMWQMLATIYDVFSRDDGKDYFIDMMPVLHNYVTVDTAALLSSPDYLNVLFQMCKTLLESTPGEDAECHAAKLLEVIILQCQQVPGQPRPGPLDQIIPAFLRLVMTRLTQEIQTSELRTMCLQVAIAALYYDADLFFKAMSESAGATSPDHVIKEFVGQWLHDTDCFVGLHDRKLSILGLCRLLELPRFPGVEDNAKRLMPSLLMLFDGLKRAYETLGDSDEDDSDGEGDEDDGEDSGEELLESDEDEIDEAGQMYLESLEGKLKTAGEQAGFKINASIQDDDDDDDDDEEDDDDDFYETSLEAFGTPIDGDKAVVDEYEAFKTVLESLQQGGHQQWYQQLVQGLSAKDMASVQEVLALCAQRKAARDSKNIEKAGGYAFQQQTVPSQFSFSPGNGANNFAFGK